MSVRPLTGIALKSCMDTLRFRIRDESVVDLFAGEGRFGIACQREQARRVVFVEKSPVQCAKLSACEAGEVVQQDVFEYLAGTKEVFSIVFADPPFPVWSEQFWQRLSEGAKRCLAVGGIFLVKTPRRVLFSLENSGLRALKSSTFGESRLSYFERLEDVG